MSVRYASFLNPIRLVAIALAVLIAAPASAVTWHAYGPGQTDLVVKGNKIHFTYELDVSRDYGTWEWIVVGRGFKKGRHEFEWGYDGVHDRRQAETSLTAPDHTLVATRSGTGAFAYTGENFIVEPARTDNFVFRMTATNDDTTKLLTGSFELAIVPLPAGWILFGTALTALGAVARRRTRLQNAS